MALNTIKIASGKLQNYISNYVVSISGFGHTLL